jgi:hypothetical protein
MRRIYKYKGSMRAYAGNTAVPSLLFGAVRAAVSLL